MRWNIGPFGLKDLFTLVNLMGGVLAIAFVADGRMEAAGVALLLGYLLGDVLDGPVARATKTSNRFGSELDTATDHFVQAIAPAIIVHGVYARGGHPTAGIVLMAIIIACATVRQALFSVAKLGDPLMYCGLPRTVSGYAAMAFVLSPLFFRGDAAGFLTGEVLIPVLALMNLLPIPYMTHRGARRMQTYVKLLVILFLVSPVALFFVAGNRMFDLLFFYLFGYAATAWIPLHRDERQRFFARYREWAADVSRS
jgi:CDP-diacylglycerol--serine O-phosphatidyltransferase